MCERLLVPQNLLHSYIVLQAIVDGVSGGLERHKMVYIIGTSRTAPPTTMRTKSKLLVCMVLGSETREAQPWVVVPASLNASASQQSPSEDSADTGFAFLCARVCVLEPKP